MSEAAMADEREPKRCLGVTVSAVPFAVERPGTVRQYPVLLARRIDPSNLTHHFWFPAMPAWFGVLTLLHQVTSATVMPRLIAACKST